jgi:hypothetical protein
MATKLIAFLIAGLSVLPAQAHFFEPTQLIPVISELTADQETLSNPMFKPGDSATYDLTLAGFIPASMVMSVVSASDTEIILNQTVTIFGQGQSCDVTIDGSTGAVKRVVCNGQEQKVPENGGVELIESKEDTITVPAGTFQTIYLKAKQKADNSVIEQWINPKLVPVGGMVKSIIPSQLGSMVAQLKSFVKK